MSNDLRSTEPINGTRNPRVSSLYQCVRRHSDELDAAGLVHRPVEAEALERFLDCGDLHQGFARVYCDQWGHDYLLAYSCKTRYFCPTCHRKRMLAYGEWLEDNVLAPVPRSACIWNTFRANCMTFSTALGNAEILAIEPRVARFSQRATGSSAQTSGVRTSQRG